VARFAEDSVLRRIYRENVLFLGGGRALLLQLAHPDVARGVAEHSSFEDDPFSRLRRTITVVDAIVFGDDDDADRAAAGLRRVHDFVTGPGYFANDPALLFWVHATLVDTGMRIYNGFVAPLSEADRERAYRDALVLGEVFGVAREEQPATYDDFRAYLRTMVGTLEVTDTARDVARAVLHPKLPAVTSPALELVRQITVGLLPRPIREQYGFRWDAPRKAALHATALASRMAHPLLPRPLRWGNALTRSG
jgi:uncharacterized protein (DUF2236 family)